MSDEGAQARLTLTERYWEVTAIADLLGLHRTSINKLVREGELKGVKFGPSNGATRVTESSLVAYMQRRGIEFTLAADGAPDESKTP
jgi:excisionase family DNA binding protein